MIQHGIVRGAMSYLTTKDSKLLGPNDMVETEPGKKWEKCVDILRRKHPEAAPLCRGTVDVDDLPEKEHVIVPMSVVEKTARKISGSGEATLTNSKHWFDCLINYGNESARLREIVAKCTS